MFLADNHSCSPPRGRRECLRAVIKLMFAICLFVGGCSPVGAGKAQGDLSQRIALPQYNPWLTDAAFSQLSQQVVTPHTPWATPYAGQELDIVVIAPRWTQRATVELQQRFDFDARAIMAYRSHTWGDKNDPHYYWIPSGTEDILTERAMATIGSPRRPDVIVIGWMNCSVIPDDVQQEIVEAVGEGTGLVIYNPRPLAGKIKTLVDSASPVEADALYSVVDGIPMGNLPPFKPQAARDLINGGLMFYRHENGAGLAVAVVDLGAGSHLGNAPPSVAPVKTPDNLPYIGSNSYFSPPSNEHVTDVHHDYYSSLAGRLILWAGNNMPEVRLAGWETLESRVDARTAGKALGALMVESKTRPESMAAELVIRDAEGNIEQESVLEINPDGRVRVAVERIKSGGHYADIILRHADGRVLDWGTTYFTSDSGARIVSVGTPEKSYPLTNPIPVNIALEGDFSGATVSVDIYDSYGRQLHAETRKAESNISVQADLSQAMAIYCEVVATVERESVLLAKKTGRVLLRQPNPAEDQYLYGAWAGKGHDFVESQSADVMIDHGIRGGIIYGDMDKWARHDVRPTPYVTRYYPENVDGKGLMVRKPCLTDPEYLKKEEAKIRKSAQEKKHYSPLGYSLGDDQGMTLTGQDACISPTCLVAFRNYLAERYASIDALNNSWGSDYSSFEQAHPESRDDVVANGHYPRWADHRMYMDKLFVDMHIWAKKLVQEVDPGARVGFEGPLMDDSWYGYEWKMLLDNLDFMVVYPNPWKFDLVRSFARPGLLSGGWYGGYAMYQSTHDLQSYPWFMLFNRCNSYWFFSGYGGSEAGHPAEAIAPDLRPLDCFKLTSKHVNRIQRGIDRLVLNAAPVHGRVAVYFSRPSVHGATVMPPIPTRDYDTDPKWAQYMAAPELKWPLNIEANLRLLDDLGLSYVFVDRHDIVSGHLLKNNFSLLVMPLVHSLSEAESQAVRKFVKSGGAVLADLRPGVFDQHIKLLPAGQLDALFGVKRNGSAVIPLRDELVRMNSSDSGHVRSQGEAGAMLPEQVDYVADDAAQAEEAIDVIPLPIDPAIVLDGGKPMATSESGSPMFITNDHGDGKAILMNLSAQHYLTLRAAGRGGGVRSLLRDALVGVDVAPEITVKAVGDHAARPRVYRCRDGDNRLVGLIRSNRRLMDEPEGFLDTATHPYVIDFGRSGHIYDVIGRHYHGEKEQLQLDIPIATAVLLAVLPYQVTGVSLQATQQQGQVTLVPTVEASSGQAGQHVVYVEITDSQGKRRPEYDMDILLAEGEGSYTFNLAMNDPPGQWQADFEDVTTGTMGQIKFVVDASE